MGEVFCRQYMRAVSVMWRCGQHRVTRDTWRAEHWLDTCHLSAANSQASSFTLESCEVITEDGGRGCDRRRLGGVPSIPGISPRADGSQHCSSVHANTGHCIMIILKEGGNTADSVETLDFRMWWAVAHCQWVVAAKRVLPTKRAASRLILHIQCCLGGQSRQAGWGERQCMSAECRVLCQKAEECVWGVLGRGGEWGGWRGGRGGWCKAKVASSGSPPCQAQLQVAAMS